MSVRLSPSRALQWARDTYRLRYYLGEFSLFSKSFRAIVLKAHFLDVDAPVESLIAEATSAAGDVDLVVLGCIPVEKTEPRLSKRAGWLLYTKHFPCYYADLTTTFDEYLNRFSSKTRSTLRRKVRKFEELSGGPLDFREYKSEQDLDEFFPLALELSSRTYQERLLGAGLPVSESFVASARKLAGADRVRAYLLFCSGKPVAYLYCPIDRGVLTYAYQGYDATYSSWSCGTVLQYLAFERLFAERAFTTFDFTEGEGEHKKLFATDVKHCAKVLCFRSNPVNVFFVVVHAGLSQFSRTLVALLDRLGLKKRLKEMFRRI